MPCCWGFTVYGLNALPKGFVPAQDKQYLISFAQLPDGASLDRTEEVIREMGEIALAEPGVANAVQFPGLSVNGFHQQSQCRYCVCATGFHLRIVPIPICQPGR